MKSCRNALPDNESILGFANLWTKEHSHVECQMEQNDDGSFLTFWVMYGNMVYLINHNLRSSYDKRQKTMNSLHSPQNVMTAGARTAIKSSAELLIASFIHS